MKDVSKLESERGSRNGKLGCRCLVITRNVLSTVLSHGATVYDQARTPLSPSMNGLRAEARLKWKKRTQPRSPNIVLRFGMLAAMAEGVGINATTFLALYVHHCEKRDGVSVGIGARSRCNIYCLHVSCSGSTTLWASLGVRQDQAIDAQKDQSLGPSAATVGSTFQVRANASQNLESADSLPPHVRRDEPLRVRRFESLSSQVPAAVPISRA